MKLATAVLLLAFVAASGAAGCGGSSRSRPPATPPSAPAVQIQTLAGAMLVVAEGCEPDLGAMTREVNGVVERAGRLGVTASLDGWTFRVRMPEATRRVCEDVHGDACIDTMTRTLHVWCPVAAHQAGGVEHEVGHALAYAAGLGCWELVGHKGTGFDCRRNTNAR